MSTLREAAQQALEALEATHYDVGSAEKQRLQVMDAITALRAALAQPEPRNQCGETCERAKLCAVCARGLEKTTQTPCDIAEDGVCEVIDCCRKLPQILEALEIGYDSAQAEARVSMAGYRPARHAAMNADVAKIAAAITAVKAALAQQDQEPVAYTGDVARRMREAEMTFHLGMPHAVVMQQMTRFHDLVCAEASIKAAVAFAIHPPRREWQGLSEEDMEDLLPLYSDPSANTEMLEFAAAIEVKLKEKNA